MAQRLERARVDGIRGSHIETVAGPRLTGATPRGGQLPFMMADCGSIGRSTVSTFIVTSFDRSGAPVGADDQ
jgi:hypothetical protein